MSSLEPLRLLEELLKPDKNNKTLAQKISKMDSEDELALESMADELEKGSKAFQADTIAYYLEALKQFKTNGNVEAADRIKNKLETLTDACVKDGMWKTGFAGHTSSTDIIAAYWEVGAIEKIRKIKEFVNYSPHQVRPGEKTELYHYMAVYRNLRMAAARWVDTRDQNVSRYHLERAKMSALTLEMKLLIKEIEEKIERLYYT